MACARCGSSLMKRSKQRRPRRFGILSMAAFAAVVVVLYYAFGGFERSLNDVNTKEANRMALQSKDNPNNLSRSEYERQRANQYGGAVRNSNSLSENQKHNDEIQNTMKQAQGQQ